MKTQVRPNLLAPAISGLFCFWGLVISNLSMVHKEAYRQNGVIGLVCGLIAVAFALAYWRRLSGAGRAITGICIVISAVLIVTTLNMLV